MMLRAFLKDLSGGVLEERKGHHDGRSCCPQPSTQVCHKLIPDPRFLRRLGKYTIKRQIFSTNV